MVLWNRADGMRPASLYGGRMSSISRPFEATTEQVWDVLSDGWLYAGWVVGASCEAVALLPAVIRVFRRDPPVETDPGGASG